MSRKPSRNVLTKAEVALVKAMFNEGGRTGQDILAYFTRPGRSINPARIVEARRSSKHAAIAPASPEELQAFLSRWPDHDHVTGLHPDDDELVVKAREAMLNAIGGYNSPRTLFRTECFIVLAVIAWTYLLHWHYGKVGVDHRSRKVATGLAAHIGGKTRLKPSKLHFGQPEIHLIHRWSPFGDFESEMQPRRNPSYGSRA